jgi:exonuclease SbcC
MYKIDQIKIENFKCIKSEIFDLSGNNLVLFDGPNGHGKTSVFDAIEIALTGQLRRIKNSNEISEVGGFDDSAYHLDDEKEILIELNLTNGKKEESILIQRRFEPSKKLHKKERNPKKFFDTVTTTLKFGGRNTNKTVEQLLNYPKINDFYGILDYVEQDENTFFLKQSSRDKFASLAELLGINEQYTNLKKVKAFLSRLGTQASLIGKELVKTRKENKDALGVKKSNVEYERLFKEREISWDKEEIQLKNKDIRDEYLLEMDDVAYLLNNKSSITVLEANSRVEKYLNNTSWLHRLVSHYWSVHNLDAFESKFKNSEELRKERSQLVLLQQGIELNDYSKLRDLIEIISKLVTNSEILESLKRDIETLFDIKKSLVGQNRIAQELRDKRSKLINHFELHAKELSINDSNCPLCLHSYKSNKDLIKQFEKTEKALFETGEGLSKQIERLELSIKVIFDKTEIENLLEVRIGSVDEVLVNGLSSEDYYNVLENAENWKEEFNKLLQVLENRDEKRLVDLVNVDLKSESVNPTCENVTSILKSSLKKIRKEIDSDRLTKAYSRYFNKNETELQRIDIKQLEQKKKYIELQFLNGINSQLETLQNQKDKLEKLQNRTQKIVAILENKIDEFVKEVISNITVPFYIYTSKILQNHPLGSGLIFKLDFEGRIPEINIMPVSSSQEASYTLSSGQLSATVVSLMLVLNRVYHSNLLSIILIDDPIQTLDEINTHSLVELLKYNFSNDQVILSTHEERHSKFIRYKYEKFGLSQKNINMREKLYIN